MAARHECDDDIIIDVASESSQSSSSIEPASSSSRYRASPSPANAKLMGCISMFSILDFAVGGIFQTNNLSPEIDLKACAAIIILLLL